MVTSAPIYEEGVTSEGLRGLLEKGPRPCDSVCIQHERPVKTDLPAEPSRSDGNTPTPKNDPIWSGKKDVPGVDSGKRSVGPTKGAPLVTSSPRETPDTGSPTVTSYPPYPTSLGVSGTPHPVTTKTTSPPRVSKSPPRPFQEGPPTFILGSSPWGSWETT